MIQRLQSLFLFIVFICSIMYFIFPIGSIVSSENIGNTLSINIWGFYYTDAETSSNYFASGWYLMVLAVINSLITLISIFLYKKRILQMRLNIFNIFIKLGFFGMIFFFLHQGKNIDYHTNLLIVLPIAEIILTVLAIRLILRDEVLIKSIDRIR